MSAGHPLHKLVFSSLVHTPKGMDLDAKKLPAVAELLKKDPSAMKVFYEVVGALQVGSGVPAAGTLLKLINVPPTGASPSQPKAKGWGSPK